MFTGGNLSGRHQDGPTIQPDLMGVLLWQISQCIFVIFGKCQRFKQSVYRQWLEL